MNQLEQKIQALLFIYGESLSYSKIAKVIEADLEKVKEAVKELEKSLLESNSALLLLTKDDRVQLITSPEHAEILEKVLKAETKEDLSPAALETLAIISYASPISRSHIDYIRGVNSSFILRTLLIRGLITRKTDPKSRNIFIYSPSDELLKYLGVTRLEEFPDYDKFRTLALSLNQGQSQEESNNN